MDLERVLRSIDAETARAFVVASRHVIDALMIEAARIQQTKAPIVVDYESATLRRDAPGGGWIGDDELRATTQRMSEAIAAERWIDGALFAIRALSALGAL